MLSLSFLLLFTWCVHFVILLLYIIFLLTLFTYVHSYVVGFHGDINRRYLENSWYQAHYLMILDSPTFTVRRVDTIIPLLSWDRQHIPSVNSKPPPFTCIHLSGNEHSEPTEVDWSFQSSDPIWLNQTIKRV